MSDKEDAPKGEEPEKKAEEEGSKSKSRSRSRSRSKSGSKSGSKSRSRSRSRSRSASPPSQEFYDNALNLSYTAMCKHVCTVDLAC